MSLFRLNYTIGRSEIAGQDVTHGNASELQLTAHSLVVEMM